MDDVKKRPLTEAERLRLAKFQEKHKNRRGRRNPSKIPARLARTSAFAPKRKQLITDSDFERIYVVPGHSVIRVSGRELGTQHRDAIYAVFRLPRKVERVRREEITSRHHAIPYVSIYETRTSWRKLLQAIGRTEHANNLMTLLQTFEEIKKVVFTVFEGNQEEILKAHKEGKLDRLPEFAARGGMGSLFDSVTWEGLELDSEVLIRYGDWSANMIQTAKLVSLNADVQFALRSDHAKTFWPYIDSMNGHTYVDEKVLAGLAGRDLWSDREDKTTRGQFRKDCKQAFEDMIRVGGIISYRPENIGEGRRKSRRYHYVVPTPAQTELDV